MNARLVEAELDMLLAALLVLPAIQPGASPQERLEVFKATLGELNKQGGSAAIRSELLQQQAKHQQ
jgi:hypothetical protein